MYVCQITGKLSRRGDPRVGQLGYIHEDKSEDGIHGSEKLHRIVVETRPKVYMEKIRNEETGKWEDIEVGRGWEIVKEVNASDEGLAIWNKMSPEEKASFHFWPVN